MKIVCVIAVLMFSMAAAVGEDDPRAFHPLDKILVTVSVSRMDEFLSEIQDFADKAKIRFQTGAYPKRGHTVNDFTLRLTPLSFFYGSSFNNPEQYVIIAYSHEDPKIWQPTWNSLRDFLTRKFGPLDKEERRVK